MTDPINTFFCFIGIVVWPELTFCVVLWQLGHPFIGIMAFLTTFGSVRTVTTERIVYR